MSRHLTDLVKDLINIPSITGEEKAMADFIEAFLRKNQTKEGKITRLNDNVIWESENHDPKKETIALVGHTDTVPWSESSWSITKPTKALEKDGKIYGRGACDMKGGVAVAMMLLKYLAEGKSSKNIVGIFYTGEEGPLPNGMTEILNAKGLPKIDKAIILEPTNGFVVHGVFTCFTFTLSAKGKAAHSSTPKAGDNAIEKLFPLIQKIQQTRLKHVDGTKEALSLTQISGGVAANCVPAEAKATFNMRLDPKDPQAEALARLGLHNLPKDVQIIIHDWSPGGVSDYTPFKRLGTPLVEPYWTDLAQLIASGVPTVNFGPGSMEQAHKADEYVPIASLKEVFEKLKVFCA